MLIVLPGPGARLNPNARVHWRARAPITKKARIDATLATYAALRCGLRELRQALADDAPIALTITFYPPDARRRDDDNMIASFKASRDGIAQALGVDDRRFQPHYVFAEPEAPGRVEVVLG
jgi:crossover junction endodeoxyribonuclease RusA